MNINSGNKKSVEHGLKNKAGDAYLIGEILPERERRRFVEIN